MPHEIHFPILLELGLNSSEVQIYEVLLEYGPKPAAELVKLTDLGRGNTYNVLTSLKEKGLVIEETGKKTVFRAVDPERLRGLAKARLESVQNLYSQLDSTLPSLKSHFNLITKKPAFRVFEGVSGMKEVYQTILKTGQPIYSLIGPPAQETTLLKWLRGSYLKQRVAAQIPVFAVMSSSSKRVSEMMSRSQSELRQASVIDEQKYPFTGDISVFGNNVAFMDHENMIAVIIESPSLAKTMRSTIKALFTCSNLPSQKPQLENQDHSDQQTTG